MERGTDSAGQFSLGGSIGKLKVLLCCMGDILRAELKMCDV